jgi:hypothetical protein
LKGAPILFASWLALVALGQACSSNETGGSSNSTSTSSSAGSGGSGGGEATPPGSCAQPGDKGNANGVGEYCTPNGGQCANFPKAPLCLADLGQDQWMCTRIGCKSGADCGDGAGCVIEKQGSACIPCSCAPDGLGCPDAGGGGGAGGAGGGSADAGTDGG